MIFGFSPVAPAFLTNDNSDVPACCRRLGAHHCSLIAKQLPVGVALKGVCDRYGRFPAVPAPPEYSKAAFAGVSRTLFAAVASRSTTAEQGQILYRVSFSRSRQKRGPPTLSL
jgi:hypothetical protein